MPWPARPVIFAVLAAVIFLGLAGHRPFPQIDDEYYAPFILRAHDPSLFRGGALDGVRSIHRPLEIVSAPLLSVMSLARAHWLASFLLAALSGVALLALLRALGARGRTLPLLLYGAGGCLLLGLGRGSYDGFFGRAFHPQWLGLVFLVFAYAAAIAGRWLRAGLWLGASFWGHAAVGIHGALALAAARLVEDLARRRFDGRSWGRLVGGAALVAGLRIGELAARFLAGPSPAPALAKGFFEEVVLWRSFHQHLVPPSPGEWALLTWLLLLGTAATVMLGARARARGPLLVGLFGAHVAFLGAYGVLGWLWPNAPLWLHRLHWSRTSPLLLVLAHGWILAAAERELDRPSERPKLCLLMVGASWLVLVLVFGAVHRAFLLLAVPPFLERLGRKESTRRRSSLATNLALLLPAVWLVGASPVRLPLDEDERALYRWTSLHSTAKDLFVVPPGMGRFRVLARRPVYVDFKSIFPLSSPDLAHARAMKARMVEVCRPDTVTGDKGYLVVPRWDRAYLRHNPPGRIAELLRKTGARFWLKDEGAAATPPHHPDLPSSEGAGLTTVFHRGRFRILSLEGRTTE